MSKRVFLGASIAVIGISLIFLFIDHRVSVGLLFGFLCSVLNYKLIEFRYKRMMKYSKWIYLGIFAGVLILVIPLFVSILFPDVMNWIGAFIGLMSIKIGLYLEAFIGKEG